VPLTVGRHSLPSPPFPPLHLASCGSCPSLTNGPVSTPSRCCCMWRCTQSPTHASPNPLLHHKVHDQLPRGTGRLGLKCQCARPTAAVVRAGRDTTGARGASCGQQVISHAPMVGAGATAEPDGGVSICEEGVLNVDAVGQPGHCTPRQGQDGPHTPHSNQDHRPAVHFICKWNVGVSLSLTNANR
jgi:hypothetical protein